MLKEAKLLTEFSGENIVEKGGVLAISAHFFL
jgi:hypothetical protein